MDIILLILYNTVSSYKAINDIFIWKRNLSDYINGAILSDPVGSPGGSLNKKEGLTRYGNTHVKDKTS